MDVETKLEILRATPLEEIIVEDDLRDLLETNDRPKHYIGFEVSGRMHIGTLILSGLMINRFIKAGFDATVFLADWHAWINNKLGGDLEKIKLAADYFEEGFKFFCPGVKIVRGSEMYDNDYWRNVIRFAKRTTLTRTVRCLTIMGRSEKDKLDTAQYIYPAMQAVDIRTLGVDVAHAGMDQRKIHVLAREVFPKLGWKKPIAMHHHILPGLKTGEKMSKSKPETAIFIHDSKEDVERKINHAWCPEKVVGGNPVAELMKYVIIPIKGEVVIERPEKFGGNITVANDFQKIYERGEIHPLDLKRNVARYLNDIIEPVRYHFDNKKFKDVLRMIS